MRPGGCDELQAALAGVDALRESVSSLRGQELLEAVCGIEVLTRKTHAAMLELVAGLDATKVAQEQGFVTTWRLLSAMLDLSAGQARARVRDAEQLASRRTLTGEVLPAHLPATAAALASGAIGTGQLKVIIQTMAALPSAVSQDDRDWAESTLAEHAQNFDPHRLKVIARRIVDQLDPDGPAPAEPEDPCPAAGELHIRDRRDGGISLEGWLDALHGTAFRGLIEQLAKPRPLAEDIPDPRTAAQRNADALVEICDLARGHDQMSTAGGEPPHVTVTVDYDTLIKQLSEATLDYGQRLSAAQTRLAACDCKIIPVVMGGDSEPLDVGRAQRTVPLGIRRALVARDRGCTFPGCDRAPASCHAHHVREWNHHGHTEVKNCVLLCPTHHRWVHATGWDITIRGNLVEFQPPAILDPHRRPLHNPLRQ
ncbi:MAG: HNH endonuclease [Actinomycetota bacterium]|nr:HNH endonuclease [Actinomycetota bacterium]